MSPTGSRPPSRNRNNEMPGDEELGFEAAVAALGKFCIFGSLIYVWLNSLLVFEFDVLSSFILCLQA